MPNTRRVVYARINRRAANQALFEERPFLDDMRLLARAEAIHAPYAENEWYATDLVIDPTESFMTGVLGFMSEEQFHHVDEEIPSWKKAPTTIIEGGTRRTLVPFAIDIREDYRYIAFAPTNRITPVGFVLGFKVLLEAAVTPLGLMPAEWDVDLIPATSRIFEWLRENPDVSQLVRVVKRSNPGRVIQGDIERMRQMSAKTKREEYSPFYGKTLDLLANPDLVTDLMTGGEKGDVDITIRTRTGRSTFRSRREIEEGTVEDWGEDWDAATDRMLEAVQMWSEGRPVQARIDQEPGPE